MTMMVEGQLQVENAVTDAAQMGFVRWHFLHGQCTPSREDGISAMDEASLRKSYCLFAQKLGIQLKLPQVTIATAIIYCHRFFLRQSLARNDRYIIAAACLFLAGKVEETPERLHNVITASYELRNSDDPEAAPKIKEKDMYEEQRRLLLSAERLVLVTLGFDLNTAHPYKPLIDAIKRLKIAQLDSLLQQLAQIAWNFINDGLQTTLCLQFEPGHIAAGALYLAAKFLRIKHVCDWELLLSKELNISFQQLEDVSNQLLESYGSLVESAHKLGISKVIHVRHREGQAPNEASPASVQLSPTVTPPVTTYVEWDDWPLYPKKDRKMEENRESQCDFDNSRSHTLQSDLTEDNTIREPGSSYYEDSDWAFDRRHSELSPSPAEDKDGDWTYGRQQSQHSPSMDEDREARFSGKSWLGCRERNLRRLGRHLSPVGTNRRGKDDTTMGIGRVWISHRDMGIRKVMGRRGSLQTLPGNQKKALTRRDFLLWLTNRKSGNRLRTSADLESRLKRAKCQAQRKVEIITPHYSQKARVRGSV